MAEVPDTLGWLASKGLSDEQLNSSNYARLVNMIRSAHPTMMLNKVGKLDVNEFGTLPRDIQELYLHGLKASDSFNFGKLFAQEHLRYNPGVHGNNISSETMQNALKPWYDVMLTGRTNEPRLQADDDIIP